jgi:hypothetical protein
VAAAGQSSEDGVLLQGWVEWVEVREALDENLLVLRSESVTTALACVAPLLGGNTEEFLHLPHLLEVVSPSRSGWPVGSGGGGVYDIISFLKALFLETRTYGAHGFWRGVALVLLLLKVEPPRRNVRHRQQAQSC